MELRKIQNKLDEISLTSKQVEQQISKYPLSFPRTKRNDVEWKMKFPMFVTSFYNLLKIKGKTPRQDDFWEFYLEENKLDPQIGQLDRVQMEGLKGRVYRTYPSLIRDIHFALFVKERGFFEKVIYNEMLDIQYGIDLIVAHNEKIFSVNLFTKTRRAFEGRYKKQFRHKKIKEFINIELPVEFRGSKKCGAFFLYSTNELSLLEEKISSHA